VSVVPTYMAATTGSQPLAGAVNQLLGTHTSQVLYAGTLQHSQTTAGSASTASNGLYLAQEFSTGSSQSAIGYVTIPVTTTTTSGSSLATTTLSLYMNSGGAPSGSALASTTITAEYANLASGGTATALVTYPLPVTGLSVGSLYWLVLSAAGTSGNHYTWYRSNQTSGASTSPTGSTWTAQTYGFEYAIYDQTVTGNATCTWDDSGARWTWLNYASGTNALSQYAEYTAGQTATGYLQSVRSLTYSTGLLAGVA
jgi:hypothetical protein